MKKKILILFSLMLISFLFIPNNIYAVKTETSNFGLIDFDSLNVANCEPGNNADDYGVVDGVQGICRINGDYGNDSRNLEMNYTSELWINFTGVPEYMDTVLLSFELRNVGCSGYGYMKFYQGNDLVMNFRFDIGGGDTDYMVQENDLTWNKLYEDPTDGAPQDYLWSIEHISGNEFNFTCKDYPNSDIGGEKDFFSYSADTWEYFDKIHIDFTGVNNAGMMFFKIDDIGIDTQSSGSADESSDLSEYFLYRCTPGTGTTRLINPFQYVEQRFDARYTGNIYGVGLICYTTEQDMVSNTTSHYSCSINGVNIGTPTRLYYDSTRHVYQWYYPDGVTLDNEKPIFSFGCSASISPPPGYTSPTGHFHWWGIAGVTGYPSSFDKCKTHDSASMFANNVFDLTDGSRPLALCYYFGNLTEDIEDIDNYSPFDPGELENYTDLYGNPAFNNTFIEFKYRNQRCYYEIGDSPILIFNLSHEYFGDTNCYGYQIRYIPYDAIAHVGFICFTGDNFNGSLDLRDDFEFIRAGQYQILLFNLTNGSIANELVGNSLILTVCEVGESGGYADTDEYVLPVLDSTIGAIVGLILTSFLSLSPIALNKGLKSNNRLPPIIFGIMGGLGVMVSALMGFFPFWTIPVMIVVIMAYVLVRYLTNKTVEG